MKTATLVQLIKEYNDAYRRGEPLVSDEEYDLLVEELKTKDPENKLLKKAIIEEIESSDRMERLPIPMYSLEKFKKIDELIEFMKILGRLLLQLKLSSHLNMMAFLCVAKRKLVQLGLVVTVLKVNEAMVIKS